nr:hypothetical protein [Streptomyces aurantiacus]
MPSTGLPYVGPLWLVVPANRTTGGGPGRRAAPSSATRSSARPTLTRSAAAADSARVGVRDEAGQFPGRRQVGGAGLEPGRAAHRFARLGVPADGAQPHRPPGEHLGDRGAEEPGGAEHHDRGRPAARRAVAGHACSSAASARQSA